MKTSKVRQMDLVFAIVREIERQGVKDLPCDRQMNSIIDAANRIIRAFSVELPVKRGMSYQEWMACDDTGLSSRWLCCRIFDLECGEIAYPHDPSELGRCLRMLENVEEAEENFKYLRGSVALVGGPVWKAYVEHWDELASLYAEESPSGNCPKLYKLMHDLQESALLQPV